MSIINKGIFDLRTAYARQTGNDWPTAQVITTTDVIENSSNLYFTNARAVSALVGANVLLNNLTIAGDLDVQGNLVYINSSVINIEDINIVLANGAQTSSVVDGAGITIHGAQANITYRNTGDKFVINKNTDFTGNVVATGDVRATGNLVANGLIIRSINVSDSVLTGNIVTTSTISNVIVTDSITANIWNRLYTANVIETSGNLYFTNARVVSALIPGTAIIIEANGRISANLSAITVTSATTAAQVLSLSNFTTANLAESSANLYFTNTRVVSALIAGDYVSIEANGRISANVSAIVVQTATTAGQVNTLSNFTTANLAEGTNLYYTNARARTAFTAGKGISLFENGTIVNIGSSSTYNLDINGSAGGNILGTMSTFATFPTTPTTTRFVLRSLHVVNMSDTISLISGNILYATGNTAPIASQIPVAVGGVLEFIKKGQLFQPGDKINLQGFNSAGTPTSNLMTAMATYEGFTSDSSFIGLGQTIANVNVNTLIYDSSQSYSIIESIKFINLQNTVTPIRAYWGDANGSPKAYLAYNLQIPPNSSVELLQAPKRIELGDRIYASYTNSPNAAVSAFVSARLGAVYTIGSYTADTIPGNTLSVSFASSAAEGSTIYYTIE